MEADDVRQLFERSLEEPAPPSSASIATAVTRGRRRQRGRLVATMGLSAITALAVVAGGLAIAGAGVRQSAPPVAAPSPSWSPNPTTTASSARFDPQFAH